MAGKPQVIRALDLMLYINGRIFGVATGFSFEDSKGTQPRYGIDLQRPQELVTTQTVVRGTVECLRKHDDAGVEGAGIVPIPTELSLARYFFLQLVDRQTDSVIFQVPKAALISQQWRVQARGVMTGSFTFEGIEWSNEF
jgi:hypothetical protein